MKSCYIVWLIGICEDGVECVALTKEMADEYVQKARVKYPNSEYRVEEKILLE